MNSRERVRAAVEHRIPDRIPIDFGGHRSSGIMAIAYANLRDYLGLPERPIKVYDVIQQLAVIDDDVYERFPTDVVNMSCIFCRDDAGWKEWTLPNGKECLVPRFIDIRKEGDGWSLYNRAGQKAGRMPGSSLYFDQVMWPYADGIPDDLDDIADAADGQMWGAAPTPPAGLLPREMAEKVREFRAGSDAAVNFAFGGSLFEASCTICSIENAMVWMLLEPERYSRLLDALCGLYLKELEPLLAELAPHIDAILFSDDLGMSTGPQFSVELLNRFFAPRRRTMWKRTKELAPGVKIQQHCCGGVEPFIDPLADAGLEAMNPVQTNCAGMDPAGLKRKFGAKMCFWGGGCDTATVLPRATPREVREHVLDRCRILSPGGGFIFQQVHNIMADVPPENVEAMFDAVKEFNDKYYEPDARGNGNH